MKSMAVVKAIVTSALGLLLTTGLAAALPYPCPSDPGFCYRDYGDDGCFDVGVDDGPINAALEAQSSFPPMPDPGSIVCPPSVEELTPANFHIRLSTQSGSSILIYTAKIDTPFGEFEAMSGDTLLLGGAIQGAGTGTLSGEADVFLEEGVVVPTGPSGFTRNLTLESLSSGVTVGSKARIRVKNANIFAAGNVIFLEKVRLTAVETIVSDADIRVIAGGDVEMTRPRIATTSDGSSSIELSGINVKLYETASIKAFAPFASQNLDIIATAGDVVIDKLSLKSDLVSASISGTNITIGTAVAGKTPRSTINERRSFDILATGAIDIDNLRLRSEADVEISTTGTQLSVVQSSLGGMGENPTIAISATGAGSTCDLTGTEIVKATLVTNCDTVIGP